MKDGAPADGIPGRGVTALEAFLCERCGPLPIRCASESAELPQGEVARVDRNNIEKTGLRFGIAEFLDPFDVVCGKVHSDKISDVNSCRSSTRRSFEASSAWPWMEYPALTFSSRSFPRYYILP